MDIMKAIITKKIERLKDAKSKTPIKDLKNRLIDLQTTEDFTNAIKRNNSGIRLIAEIKKASPTKGIIREDFDLAAIALIYKDTLVDAISIVTEEDFFKGELRFISYVKGITKKPVLRKDFIVDEYQIYEARANKADAILLIAAILQKTQAQEYLHIASELELAVLFEVHDEDDLQKAFDINAQIIGINNRNLKTMEIDLSNTLRLKRYIPTDKIIVAESGIKNKNDVITINNAAVDAMLVGTSIIQATDMKSKINELTCI